LSKPAGRSLKRTSSSQTLGGQTIRERRMAPPKQQYLSVIREQSDEKYIAKPVTYLKYTKKTRRKILEFKVK
jgi:hypothetical protein